MSENFKGQLTKVPAHQPELEAEISKSIEEPAVTAQDPPPNPPVLDNVIRISFPVDIPLELKERFLLVKKCIDDWHSWVQGRTGELIDQKQKSGELPIDVENVDSKIKVDNYGARVFDTYLRIHSPWLPVFYRDQKDIVLNEKKFDVHNTILKSVLNDFVAEPRLQSKLEGAFDIISKAISFGVNKTKLDRSIWIMLEFYTYDSEIDIIRPVIRTVSFDAGVESREYTSEKAQYKEVTTNLRYYQTDAKFVQETWDLAKDDVRKVVSETVHSAVTEKFDVPVGK